MDRALTTFEAEEILLSDAHLPKRMVVDGSLRLKSRELRALPRFMHVSAGMDVSDCPNLEVMPESLAVGGNLLLVLCRRIRALPLELRVGGHLSAAGCEALATMPESLTVAYDLNLENCPSLRRLPKWLFVGYNLYLPGCTALEALPDGLAVGSDLDLRGCQSLRTLPADLRVGGILDIHNCTALVPESGLGTVAGEVWMDARQMERVPARLLPLMLGYRYSNPAVPACIERRLAAGK